jgi:hypothetical protein
LALLALLGLWLAGANPLWAHGGGTPRLTSAPTGPYRVYAWSQPEPWRAGEVHLSIAVTLPAEESAQADGAQVETPVTNVDIQVTFTPPAGAAAPIVVQAQPQDLLGNYYFEADPELPVDGLWQIAIAVVGAAGSGTTEFTIEALPARSLNWPLVLAAGGVLVLIVALIGIWSRQQQPASAAQRPVRRTAGRPAR